MGRKNNPGWLLAIIAFIIIVFIPTPEEFILMAVLSTMLSSDAIKLIAVGLLIWKLFGANKK